MQLKNMKFSTVSTIEAFSEIGKTLTSTLEIEEVFRVILQKISHLFSPSSWSLSLFNVATQELRYEILINRPQVNRLMPIDLKTTLSGWAVQNQKGLHWNKASGLHLPPDLSALPENVHSVMCVPLKSKGKAMGAIELWQESFDKEAFSEEEYKILSIIGDFSAISLENAHNFKRIEELTIKDDLTGLYNSRQMYTIIDTEVTRAQRYHKEFSMIFFDLDHFKEVNDTHGHMHGSELIREVGELVQKHIRNVDFGARYGGDEFVVMLPETDKAGAILMAERLRKAVEGHTFLKSRGLEAKFTASFGVANFPTDAQTKEELIKMADDAMYKAKKTSRNKVEAA